MPGRVLIVDDDPGLRRSLSLLLDAEGYAVRAEGDPVGALDLALTESFDLILCDVRMPASTDRSSSGDTGTRGGPRSSS